MSSFLWSKPPRDRMDDALDTPLPELLTAYHHTMSCTRCSLGAIEPRSSSSPTPSSSQHSHLRARMRSCAYPCRRSHTSSSPSTRLPWLGRASRAHTRPPRRFARHECLAGHAVLPSGTFPCDWLRPRDGLPAPCVYVPWRRPRRRILHIRLRRRSASIQCVARHPQC
ncbi:hypothetical protein BC628DRAFT_1382192 [Trametes gibbosa]|nr:hypothetical protein BC628DRAFT_1382192 [Trametes gibbosa]